MFLCVLIAVGFPNPGASIFLRVARRQYGENLGNSLFWRTELHISPYFALQATPQASTLSPGPDFLGSIPCFWTIILVQKISKDLPLYTKSVMISAILLHFPMYNRVQELLALESWVVLSKLCIYKWRSNLKYLGIQWDAKQLPCDGYLEMHDWMMLWAFEQFHWMVLVYQGSWYTCQSWQDFA